RHVLPLHLMRTDSLIFPLLIVSLYALVSSFFFFFNATAPTEIYTLSLHDALPISGIHRGAALPVAGKLRTDDKDCALQAALAGIDRKSTRLNSSHSQISYAVFCLKKKKKTKTYTHITMTQPLD